VTTIPQRHRRTDGQIGQIAVAIPRSAKQSAVKILVKCNFFLPAKKSSQEYREFKTVVEADNSKQNMSEIQKQNRKRNMIWQLHGDEKRENGKL